jgi:hypothetical protein
MLSWWPVALKGDAWVFVYSNRCGALVALAMAVALGGCANNNYDLTGSWFSKPLDLFGSRAGYSYSNLGDSKQEHPITANDLVDADGACPRLAGPPQMQPAPGNAGTSPAPSADAASLLGGGVAIGMSECDVVARLGQPTAVNLGRNPNGDRTAVLTFKGGPRPGVYRFASGRLTEMDRVEAPPPEPAQKKPAKKKPAKKKPAKKKPEKPQKPPTTSGKT